MEQVNSERRQFTRQKWGISIYDLAEKEFRTDG